MAYVEANIVDKDGVLVPDATNTISFKISGPASILAVDNGDNSSHEPFHATTRRAYQGRCFAIIKSDSVGKITVEASAQGLGSTSTKLQATTARN